MAAGCIPGSGLEVVDDGGAGGRVGVLCLFRRVAAILEAEADLAGKLVDDAQLQDDVVVDAHALAVRQRLGPVLQPGIVRELPTQQVGEAGTQGAVHVLLVRRARLPEARPEGHCPLVSRLYHQMPAETGSGSEFVVEATEAVILRSEEHTSEIQSPMSISS